MPRERRAVIVSGVRTPVGKYMGALRDVPAYDLGALVLNEALRRIGLEPSWLMKSSWGNHIRAANTSTSLVWRY
jgi:acetyl-CoA acetyltransferase